MSRWRMFRWFGLGLIAGLFATACLWQSTVPSPAQSPVAQANPLGDARILYGKGDFDGAITKYQEFLKDHPRSPDAFAGIARAHLKQKDIDHAAEIVEQGLKLTDAPRLHVARGE